LVPAESGREGPTGTPWRRWTRARALWATTSWALLGTGVVDKDVVSEGVVGEGVADEDVAVRASRRERRGEGVEDEGVVVGEEEQPLEGTGVRAGCVRAGVQGSRPEEGGGRRSRAPSTTASSRSQSAQVGIVWAVGEGGAPDRSPLRHTLPTFWPRTVAPPLTEGNHLPPC
jgi:hypothetical protein